MRLWLVLLLLSLPGECGGGSGDLVPLGQGSGLRVIPGRGEVSYRGK